MLVRLSPFLDESLISYIIRLCKANCWCFKAFSKYLNKKFGRITYLNENVNSAIIEYIATITNNNDVYFLMDKYRFKIFNYESMISKEIKICKECYSETKRIYNYWSLKNYLICCKHNKLLINSCNKCNTQFSEDTFVMNRCLYCNASIFDMDCLSYSPDGYSLEIFNIFHNNYLPIDFKKNHSKIEFIRDEVNVISYILNYNTQGNRKTTVLNDKLNLKKLYDEQLMSFYYSKSKDELYNKFTSIIYDCFDEPIDEFNINKIFKLLNKKLTCNGASCVREVFKKFLLTDKETHAKNCIYIKRDVSLYSKYIVYMYNLSISKEWLEDIFEIKRGLLSLYVIENKHKIKSHIYENRRILLFHDVKHFIISFFKEKFYQKNI